MSLSSPLRLIGIKMLLTLPMRRRRLPPRCHPNRLIPKFTSGDLETKYNRVLDRNFPLPNEALIENLGTCFQTVEGRS